jgi:transcriptional regulator of acetoin/glycerol metabolism
MLPERMRDYGGRHARNLAKRADGGDRYAERLKKALTICRGNKSAAARFLGISRGTLYKDLKRSGLSEYIREQRAS